MIKPQLPHLRLIIYQKGSIMVSYKVSDFNPKLDDYEKIIINLEVKQLKCPNCGSCDMERHGYYKRYIIINGIKYPIRILRIRCKECGKTHAVLPSFVVPYLHYPIEELSTMIIKLDNNEKLDLYDHEIRQVKKIYKLWMKKIRSLEVRISDKLSELIKVFSSTFKRCYMQIHQGSFFLVW